MEKCSFCNKSQGEVFIMVKQDNLVICDECILTCNEILTKHIKEEKNKCKVIDFEE